MSYLSDFHPKPGVRLMDHDKEPLDLRPARPTMERTARVLAGPEAHGPDEVQRERTDAEIIDELFTYHPPNPGQQERYEAIRAAAKSLALTIWQACPRSYDRAVAIRKLRECVMTANAAIALRGLI